MGVKISFGSSDKSAKVPEQEKFDPAKKLLQAIFPPKLKGLPVVDKANWHNWVKHWTAEDEWWATYLIEETISNITEMFRQFQLSDSDSFTKWTYEGLPKTVIDGNFGSVPVQVQSVDQQGNDTTVILQVGVYTLEIVEWIANLLKKPEKKKKPEIELETKQVKVGGIAVEELGGDTGMTITDDDVVLSEVEANEAFNDPEHDHVGDIAEFGDLGG